jgi:hypothetical protein
LIALACDNVNSRLFTSGRKRVAGELRTGINFFAVRDALVAIISENFNYQRAEGVTEQIVWL